MPELQGAQFNQLASELKEPDGGFSIRTTSGRRPSSGYMVSQAGTERKYPAETEVTGQHIHNYAKDNATDLGRRGRYLGGWHDPGTHAKDLDVSRRYASHDRGRQAMWGSHQDALFNLGEGRSEHNFAKLGTAGTAIGKYVDDPPLPAAEHTELQKAARARQQYR